MDPESSRRDTGVRHVQAWTFTFARIAWALNRIPTKHERSACTNQQSGCAGRINICTPLWSYRLHTQRPLVSNSGLVFYPRLAGSPALVASRKPTTPVVFFVTLFRISRGGGRLVARGNLARTLNRRHAEGSSSLRPPLRPPTVLVCNFQRTQHNRCVKVNTS